MAKRGKGVVDSGRLKRLYEKYAREPVVDAAALSDLLAFARAPELKIGIFFVFLFFFVFGACFAVMPLVLGGEDAIIASSFHLKTIVPIAALVVALVVVLGVFQFQFALLEHRQQRFAEFMKQAKNNSYLKSKKQQ
ncbi:MAG: hypothetical protein ACP5O3_00690 [Candidatus Micrarchaeia archaeon]|jgi:acyl-CoA synthetase (AMP-forming)/AMP-acid ligase II